MVADGTTLSMMGQVFYNIALFSTIFFIIKLIIFMVFGGDTEVNADFNSEFDSDPSFNFISVQSLLAFLMGFGWMGYASLEWKFSALISIVFAIAGGLILMSISVWLVFMMRKLNSTPKYDLNSLVEKTGTSYTKFDAKGTGKIQIEFNGKLETFEAWNETEESIESFKNIKVIKIVDNKIFIQEV